MRESKYKKQRKAHELLINDFAAYLQARNYAKDTMRADTNYTAYYLEWLKQQQTQETEANYNDLLTYIDHCTTQGDSKLLINHKLCAIRKYYDYLLYKGKATKNPATGLFIKNKSHTVPSNLLTPEELSTIYENYQVTDLRSQRNKVITGLLVFQALTRQELEKLELIHIKLTAGKIEVPGGKHSNPRTLKLEPVQMLDLQEYLIKTRPEITRTQGIYASGRKPDSINKEKAQVQLFISMHGSDNIKSSFLHLLYSLRKLNPKLINAQQIRQSVISIWLKTKDLRTSQYMAGHRYVSSTERYQINQLDDLQDALNLFHPLGNEALAE
jgi:integrase/recombinase XerD